MKTVAICTFISYRNIFLTSIDFSNEKSHDIRKMHLRLGKRHSKIKYGMVCIWNLISWNNIIATNYLWIGLLEQQQRKKKLNKAPTTKTTNSDDSNPYCKWKLIIKALLIEQICTFDDDK